MPHIIELEENKQGDDIIIGDIHGEITTFETVIKTLNSNDRLFIAGDLIDKGVDSLGVLEKILSVNETRAKSGLVPQIYSVRGNHEDIFLEYADRLLNPKNYADNTRASFEEYRLANGGEWVDVIEASNIAVYQKFIETLPYIICVGGKNPFNIAHADLIFSDEELQNKTAFILRSFISKSIFI